jgi:hypothetical protein
MAGSKADYLELELLKWATGQTNDLGAACTPYIALFTTAPGEAGGGVEVSGGSYARQDSSGKWAAPAAGAVQTNAEIAFPQATADWGTVVAFAIMDAVSGGNFLYWADLTASKTVNNGDTFKFPSGNIDLTED